MRTTTPDQEKTYFPAVSRVIIGPCGPEWCIAQSLQQWERCTCGLSMAPEHRPTVCCCEDGSGHGRWPHTPGMGLFCDLLGIGIR